MNSLTDEQLMDIFRKSNGDTGSNALDHLYNRYSKRLVNFFYYSFWKDHEKAQDFLHDLFLKIIENKAKFDENHSFQAWIFRIASNMCKNEYRSLEIDRKYQTYITNSTDGVENEQLNNDLQFYINTLEPEQRSLIILRFKFNMTIKEMAVVFECPEGTIKSRLFYATKELSSKYKN